MPNSSNLSSLVQPPPLKIGVNQPDRYRITLAGMMTDVWLLAAAWCAGGLVLALLGFWEIGLVTSAIGLLVDLLFQIRLRRLWRAADVAGDNGIRHLVPIVACRFSLGVSGAIAVALTAPGPEVMAAVMMLQAWSICVAMAQFCAVPRLFVFAIAPPLIAVICALWPYLFGAAGLALLLSLVLLTVILLLIGKQVGDVWMAWSDACRDNAQLIDELNAARRDAEAASQAKSTFLATMSHEVRTPLNGILGMSQIMALNALDEPQRERLGVIRRSGETLLGTLNAVLDLSRIEAGRLELVDGVVWPERTVMDSVNAFSASGELKGISVTGSVEPEAARAFRGDPVRLQQIVDNLVGNAVKFTEHGGVHVSAVYRWGTLVLEVRDTGDGIAADDLARIFRPFEQVERSHMRSREGSGLGLAICRQLARLMKGQLSAESTPGSGSLFRFTMPTEPVQPLEANDQPEAGDLNGLSVLVAEDNPTNQIVIRTLLEHLGTAPYLVENGQLAIDALSQHAFDLVLMDVQMPVMDGLAATRAIRHGQAGYEAVDVAVIGLTGNAMTHQVEECLAAGMTAVVAKPIQLPVLIATINAALSEPTVIRSKVASGFSSGG